MSTLGDTADVNPVIKLLPHTCNVCSRNLIRGLTSAASPKEDMSRTCKVGQKFGVSLLRRDHPGYRNAEVGNLGGTYKLPCINILRKAVHQVGFIYEIIQRCTVNKT